MDNKIESITSISDDEIIVSSNSDDEIYDEKIHGSFEQNENERNNSLTDKQNDEKEIEQDNNLHQIIMMRQAMKDYETKLNYLQSALIRGRNSLDDMKKNCDNLVFQANANYFDNILIEF